MTRAQAINYVKSSVDKNTYKALMSNLAFDKESVINYLRLTGIREEVLKLL
jgi:hypothetical protein